MSDLTYDPSSGTFRILYRVDADAIAIIEVFSKKAQQTSTSVIEACKRRLREYDQLI